MSVTPATAPVRDRAGLPRRPAAAGAAIRQPLSSSRPAFLSLGLRRSAYVWPTLLFLGVGFALANGLGYGDGNLRQYLLHGLHRANPAFLAQDWFTTQTRPHHIAFNWMIALASGLGRLDVWFAAANAVLAMGFVFCVYAVAARYFPAPLVVTSITLLLIVFHPPYYIGLTPIISMYFQPSTIGFVGTLAALICLCRRRLAFAGLFFMVSGICHLNYMVWNVVIVLAVIAINGRRFRFREACSLIAPLGLAVLFHSPFFAQAWAPEQTARAVPAAHILHDIYMPFHSRPRTWDSRPFVEFGLIVALGMAAWRVAMPARRTDRLTRTVLGILAGILVAGTLLTLVIQVDAIAMLFPFRLAPLLIVTSYIVISGSIVTTALPALGSRGKNKPGESEASNSLRWFARFAWWFTVGVVLHFIGTSNYGLACVAVIAMSLLPARIMEAGRNHGSHRRIAMSLAGGGIVLYAIGAGGSGVAVFAILSSGAWLATRLRPSPIRMFLLHGARIGLPIACGALLLTLGARRKDLLGPPPAGDVANLYAWCRDKTPADAVFIIPPDLAGFRLGAQRAVVADWKCMPILPRDTVEWYRRIVSICGREVASERAAAESYRHMDLARARRLYKQFGAQFLLCDRVDENADLSKMTPAFLSERYVVLDLGGD